MQPTHYLSQNLRDIIDITGLSIPNFAKWLDIKEYTLRNYMKRDDINPSFDLIHDISRKLCLYPADLMFRKINWDEPDNIDIINELITNPDTYREKISSNLYPEYSLNENTCISQNLFAIIARCKEFEDPNDNNKNIESFNYNKDIVNCLNMVGSKILNLPNFSESQFLYILNNKKNPRFNIVYNIALKLYLLGQDSVSLNSIMVHKLFKDEYNDYTYIDPICDSLCTIRPFLEYEKLEPTLCSKYLLPDHKYFWGSKLLMDTTMKLNDILKGGDDVLLYDCMQKLYIIDEDIYDYYKSLLLNIYTELHFDETIINEIEQRGAIREIFDSKKFDKQENDYYEQVIRNYEFDISAYIRKYENRRDLLLMYYGIDEPPEDLDETTAYFINENSDDSPFALLKLLSQYSTSSQSKNDLTHIKVKLKAYMLDVKKLIPPENTEKFENLSQDFLEYYDMFY